MEKREPERVAPNPPFDAALRRLQWSVAVLAGLAGAIAIHLIFVGSYLSDIVQHFDLDQFTAKALVAAADFVGGAAFLLVAAPRR